MFFSHEIFGAFLIDAALHSPPPYPTVQGNLFMRTSAGGLVNFFQCTPSAYSRNAPRLTCIFRAAWAQVLEVASLLLGQSFRSLMEDGNRFCFHDRLDSIYRAFLFFHSLRALFSSLLSSNNRLISDSKIRDQSFTHVFIKKKRMLSVNRVIDSL